MLTLIKSKNLNNHFANFEHVISHFANFEQVISIQFFNLHTCDCLTGHHATPEVTLHLPREAEDFPRGDNQSKHVPLPTYLD